MKKLLLLIATVFLLAFSTVIPRVGPIETHVPLVYKIQIDDAPLVRWAPIIKDYNHTLHRFVEFLDLLPIPKGFYDGVEWYAKNQFHYQDFVAEVDAVAQISGVPFQKIMFLNLLYEFTTINACTGIVLRNSEGKIMHGRNWDFEMFEILGSMIVKLEYYRGEEKIYSEDAVVGSVFAMTGIKPGAFAISCNARHPKQFAETLISVLVQNNIPTLWHVKKVFLECKSYAEATQRLRDTNISCPIYFIVSGVKDNEGMVIQRETDHTRAYYELSDFHWFLVQTNHDRDEPEPLDDRRRIPAEKKLTERGNKDLDENVLLKNFMFQWPNYNIATIFTDVMVPATGYTNTTMWYGTNPVQHTQ